MVDLLPDVGPHSQELPIYPVEYCLQKVPLARILAVKQLQDVQNEGLVHIMLGQGCLEVRSLQETQEESVHKLNKEKNKTENMKQTHRQIEMVNCNWKKINKIYYKNLS